MYYKIIDNGFIAMIGEKINGESITKQEYDSLLSIIHNVPSAPIGYTYKLKSDTLTWELVELPPIDDTDEDATESDYIDALNDLGVEVN